MTGQNIVESASTGLLGRSVAELAEGLAAKEFSSAELTEAYLQRIDQVEDTVKAFITLTPEQARETAARVDNLRSKGEELPPLAGIPVTHKDLIVTKGIKTTAASQMLAQWIPPYDATVYQRTQAAGMPLLGKTNLDEFAMGSTTEHSAFHHTMNPWDTDRVPGGSSGGAAAAIAAGEAPLSVGTDTGGSVRQPAAFTGTVGMKPTYGSISRYGVIAMASSLDQVGPMGRTVGDTAALHAVLAGHDPADSTSLPESPDDFVAAARDGAREGALRGVRLGVIRELLNEESGLEPEVRHAFQEALTVATGAGAEVIEVDLPSLSYALNAYYLIMPSEVSSNLARYDGVRFGTRVLPDEGPVTAETMMRTTRAAGFGPEVKRRIILGTYALSAGYYDAFYGSAQKVRTLVQQDLARVFDSVDALLSPTTPTRAFGFGAEDAGDPLALYMGDIATIPANLAGVPALSLPIGLAGGLPVGAQLIAPARADARLYRLGAGLESALGLSRGLVTSQGEQK